MSRPPMRQFAVALVAAAGLLSTATSAAPSETLYVIVSTQSRVQTISVKDLLSLYTGRARTLSNGDTATPLDQARDGAARAFFYQSLTGMDIARINSYWARLHFTGQVQPPQMVDGDAAVVQRVRADPAAIGYLTQQPHETSVRVVLMLP